MDKSYDKNDVLEFILSFINESNFRKYSKRDYSKKRLRVEVEDAISDRLSRLGAKNPRYMEIVKDNIQHEGPALRNITLYRHFTERNGSTKSYNRLIKRTLLFCLDFPLPKHIDEDFWSDAITIWDLWDLTNEPANKPKIEDPLNQVKSIAPTPKESLESDKSFKKNDQRLEGPWYIYIRDKEGVVKSYLNFTATKLGLEADFMSVRQNRMAGPVILRHDLLMISLWDVDKNFQVVLRAVVNENMLMRKERMISGVNSVIVDASPLGLPFILWKVEEGVNISFDDSVKAEYVDLDKTHELEDIERQIVRHLMIQTPVYSPSFSSGDPAEILKKSNEEYLKRKGCNYSESVLKELCEREWVSISRIHDDDNNTLSVYYWDFYYDTSLGICNAIRSNQKNERRHRYSGELTQLDSRYWFDLTNSKGRVKRLFGEVKKDKEGKVYLLYASSNHDKRYQVAREILFEKSRFKKEILNSNPTSISYSDFLNNLSIDYPIKIHLNYPKNTVLSFPEFHHMKTRHAKQQKAAEQYAGDYLLYLRNAYDKEGDGWLTRFTLKIDHLAHAEMVKKYDPDKQKKGFKHPPGGFRYVGYAEAMNKSLLCHFTHDTIIINKKRQDASILFYIPDSNESNPDSRVLVGLILDTDIRENPDASVCIAIKYGQLNHIVSKFDAKHDLESGEMERVNELLRESDYKAHFSANFGIELESVEQLFQKASHISGLLIFKDHS